MHTAHACKYPAPWEAKFCGVSQPVCSDGRTGKVCSDGRTGKETSPQSISPSYQGLCWLLPFLFLASGVPSALYIIIIFH